MRPTMNKWYKFKFNGEIIYGKFIGISQDWGRDDMYGFTILNEGEYIPLPKSYSLYELDEKDEKMIKINLIK